MKYNHLEMLPIRAFKPRSGSRFTAFGGGGMTLEGGGGGFVSDIVESVTSPFEQVGQAVSNVAQTISDVGVQIDKSVNDSVPGGWATVGAVVATVVTMGAASELLAADLAAEVAADAAMAAETAGAAEAGMEAATIGAEAAVESGADLAVAAGESTSIATDVGSTVAEAVGEGAEMVGPSVDLIGGYDVAAANAQQLALQEAAQAAATGAAKGAGIAALKDVVTTGNINPNDLLTGAVTGGVGGGLGNLANTGAQYLTAGSDLAQYTVPVGQAAAGIAGGIAGGATGAEMSGRDPLTGAITGGISGLTGAAALGSNLGLQSAGVDPLGAGLLTQTAMGAGKAALAGQDPLTGALNSGVGAMLGTGLNAAGSAAYNDIKNALPSASDLGISSTSPITADTGLPSDIALAASSTGANADITKSSDYQMAIALGYTPDQAIQYAQTLAADQAAMSGPSPYAPLASTGETQLVTVSPANEADTSKGTSAGSTKDQLASDLSSGNITQEEYNKDMAVIDPSYVPPTALDFSTTGSVSDLSSAINSANQQAGNEGSTPTYNPLGTGPSESAADNPMKITNNADGSVTVNENDGTQRLFTPTGTVISIAPDGTMTVDSPAQAAADAEKVQGSGVNLGSLASGLLGNILNNSTGKSGSSLIPGLIGAGAGIAAAANQPAGWNPTEQVVPNSSLNWQSNPVVVGPTGQSFGQQIINPVKAAEGGLMSITPTVGQNGFNNLQDGNQDPTSSVQVYAHGGVVKTMHSHGIHPTKENIDTANHLIKSGQPAHLVMGFLKHRMAQGGSTSDLGGYSDGGRMLKGPGDGMSDDIPASIGGKQPARLATDEFVVPADVVSHLGNGSSDAGAKVLYNMMDKIRKARTGTTKQGKQINPHKFMPKG